MSRFLRKRLFTTGASSANYIFKLVSRKGNNFVHFCYKDGHQRLINLRKCRYIDFKPDKKTLKFYVDDTNWYGMTDYSETNQVNHEWDIFMKDLSRSTGLDLDDLSDHSDSKSSSSSHKKLIDKLTDNLNSARKELQKKDELISEQKVKIVDLQTAVDREKQISDNIKNNKNPFSDAFR